MRMLPVVSRMCRAAVPSAMMFGLLFTAVGCCSGTARFNVHVALADSFKDSRSGYPTVEVHVVGANSTQYARLWKMSVNQYWQQGGNASSDKKVMSLNAGHTSDTLQATDPIWATWEGMGAQHLFVIANWPRPWPDKEGDSDERRVVIPLDNCRWKGRGKQIEIQIDPSAVNLKTPPNPASKLT